VRSASLGNCALCEYDIIVARGSDGCRISSLARTVAVVTVISLKLI
jgi:hypothetical protein